MISNFPEAVDRQREQEPRGKMSLVVTSLAALGSSALFLGYSRVDTYAESAAVPVISQAEGEPVDNMPLMDLSGYSGQSRTEQYPSVEVVLPTVDSVSSPASGSLALAERSPGHPIVAAPMDNNVPPEIVSYLNSVVVSVGGNCSGMLVDGEGVAFSPHCVSYNKETNIADTFGVYIYFGGQRTTSTMKIADDMIVYKNDIGFLAWPPYSAQGVADKFFARQAQLDPNSIADGSPIYFGGYPVGAEQATSNRQRILFKMAAVGPFTANVVYSANDVRPTYVFATALNATQEGLGCTPGSSGGVAINEDLIPIGPAAVFMVQVPNRDLFYNRGTHLSVDNAIKAQMGVASATGNRVFSDLVCGFAIHDPSDKGKNITFRYRDQSVQPREISTKIDSQNPASSRRNNILPQGVNNRNRKIFKPIKTGSRG